MSCMAEPTQEHQWLQQFVGEWSYESECLMGPDQPPMKFSGTESVRSIGDLWVMGEGQGEMPGETPATMIITLGYDPQQQRFVGTWIGSMMTHLWIYDGWLDAERKILTLESEGPDMEVEGKMAKYRDVFEIKSDGHRVLTASVLGEDGQWNRFMTTHYRRQV